MKFMIYADGQLVGWSDFPKGDPPMGCVTGSFHPEEGYEKIRPLMVERWKYDVNVGPVIDEPLQRWLDRFHAITFTIIAEDGGALHPVGIDLVDFSDVIQADEEPGPYEISLLGLHWEEYDRYFKHRRDEYDKRFGS